MSTISAVIAVRPGKEPVDALAALAAARREGFDVEIVLAEGTAPSRQRNRAVEAASGELIYFLDDDAAVAPDAMLAAVSYFREHPEVAVVGGPALTRSDAGAFEQAVGVAMGLPWTAGATAARHHAIGAAREVDGHELSLCNLMVRRAVLERMTGFSEHLYPGEDPEFLKRVRASGERMIYLPHMLVRRSRRQSLLPLFQQFFRYGQGRASHIGYRFTLRDLQFFAPLVLLLAVLAAVLTQHPLLVAAVSSYLVALLAAGWIVARVGAKALPYFVLAAATMHLSYGLGMLAGFFRGIRRSTTAEVKLQIRKL